MPDEKETKEAEAPKEAKPSPEMENVARIVKIGLEAWKEIEATMGTTAPEKARIKILEIALMQNTRHIFYIEEQALKDAILAKCKDLSPEEALMVKLKGSINGKNESITEGQKRYLYVLRSDNPKAQEVVTKALEALGIKDEWEMTKAQGIILIEYLKALPKPQKQESKS